MRVINQTIPTARSFWRIFTVIAVALLLAFSTLATTAVQAMTSSSSTTPQFLGKWGSNGSGNGQFINPWAVAIDNSGNVYVADSNNHRIQKFDANGTYLGQWGSQGSGDGEFMYTSGVAIDNAGNVYVVDEGNHRIQKFDANGNYLDQWGAEGSTEGKFLNPRGVAIDTSGNIYVTDQYNHRVQKFVFPQNLASLNAHSSSADISLVLPSGSDIAAHQAVSAPVEDTSYDYPLGLLDFTFTATSTGATVPVELTFETGLKPGEVTARKYDASTQTYSTITGATVSETTLDGKPALTLSYTITDGGTLDEDGVANGVIVDPVGLGVVVTGSTNTNGSLTGAAALPGAPNTGLKSQNMLLFTAALTAGISLLLGLVAPLRRKVYGMIKK